MRSPASARACLARCGEASWHPPPGVPPRARSTRAPRPPGAAGDVGAHRPTARRMRASGRRIPQIVKGGQATSRRRRSGRGAGRGSRGGRTSGPGSGRRREAEAAAEGEQGAGRKVEGAHERALARLVDPAAGAPNGRPALPLRHSTSQKARTAAPQVRVCSAVWRAASPRRTRSLALAGEPLEGRGERPGIVLRAPAGRSRRRAPRRECRPPALATTARPAASASSSTLGRPSTLPAPVAHRGHGHHVGGGEGGRDRLAVEVAREAHGSSEGAGLGRELAPRSPAPAITTWIPVVRAAAATRSRKTLLLHEAPQGQHEEAPLGHPEPRAHRRRRLPRREGLRGRRRRGRARVRSGGAPRRRARSTRSPLQAVIAPAARRRASREDPGGEQRSARKTSLPWRLTTRGTRWARGMPRIIAALGTSQCACTTS